jgi:DNA recombination protein Rad52
VTEFRLQEEMVSRTGGPTREGERKELECFEMESEAESTAVEGSAKRKRGGAEVDGGGSGVRRRVRKESRDAAVRSRKEVKDLLDAVASPLLLSLRPGPGGQMVGYLSGNNCVALANHVFGFDGWWSETLESCQVGKTEVQGNRSTVAWRTKVVIMLSEHLGGARRSDTGYGHATEGQEATAMEKAAKESVTDALKRALFLFGNVFSCFKDKQFLAVAKAAKMKAGSVEYPLEAAVNPWGWSVKVANASNGRVAVGAPKAAAAGPEVGKQWESDDEFGSDDEFC